MTLIRHRNRGDVDEGGCDLCKPRHKREDDLIPVDFVADEGLNDYLDQIAPHQPEDDWTFGV